MKHGANETRCSLRMRTVSLFDEALGNLTNFGPSHESEMREWKFALRFALQVESCPQSTFNARVIV